MIFSTLPAVSDNSVTGSSLSTECEFITVSHNPTANQKGLMMTEMVSADNC